MLTMLNDEYVEQSFSIYIVRTIYLPWNIVLNNSLLLDYLILGSFSYCDSPFPHCSPSTHYIETNPPLGQRLRRLCLPKL